MDKDTWYQDFFRVMMSMIEPARNGKCKAKNEARGRVKSCTEAGGTSALGATWVSELNFAHKKRILRVARRPEICRPEWEEAHKVLQEAVSQRKALAKNYVYRAHHECHSWLFEARC